MHDRQHLLVYLPKSKIDVNAVVGLSRLSNDQLTTIATDLLEWTMDSNWPVAEPISELLLRLGDAIVSKIEDIFDSGDHEWIWHIMTPLVSRLPISAQSILLPKIFGYLAQSHNKEYDEHLVDYLVGYTEMKYGKKSVGTTTTACDLTSEISLIPTEHGGKSQPIRSGYRPQFYYNCNDWDVKLEWVGPELVNPGESFEAKIQFLSPDKQLGYLKPGSHFLIREGQNMIGYGHVDKIVDLEFSAIRIATWRIESQKKYINT